MVRGHRTGALAHRDINGTAGETTDQAFESALTKDALHWITVLALTSSRDVGGVPFLTALQSFDGGLVDETFDGPSSHAMSNLVLDTTENFIHSSHGIRHAKTRPQQDLIEVLPVVGLRFLSRFLNGLGGKTTTFRKNLLGLIVDSRLYRTRALRSTDKCGSNRTRTARCQRHGQRTDALCEKVNRGNREGFERGIELATEALVFSLVHDATHLVGVFARLR